MGNAEYMGKHLFFHLVKMEIPSAFFLLCVFVMIGAANAKIKCHQMENNIEKEDIDCPQFKSAEMDNKCQKVTSKVGLEVVQKGCADKKYKDQKDGCKDVDGQNVCICSKALCNAASIPSINFGSAVFFCPVHLDFICFLDENINKLKQQ